MNNALPIDLELHEAMPNLGRYHPPSAIGDISGAQDSLVHLAPPSTGDTTAADPNGLGGPTSPPDIHTMPVASAPPGDVLDNVQPSTSTVAAPATPINTGGAGLAGNGPLLDALTGMVGGGGFESPLDASSSPSTAAIEALQPTASNTSSTSNPLLIILVIATAGIGAFIYFKNKKKKPQ